MKKLLLLAFFVATALLNQAEAAELTVLNNSDNDPDSLRALVAASNPGDVILFDQALNGATIALETGAIVVNQPITIDASDLEFGLTITRSTDISAQIDRIFEVNQPGVLFDSLTIENGKAPDATAATQPENGGGILTGAGLTLRRCTIRDCEAGDGHPSNNFGGGGGGIFNNGTLVIEECTFYNNRAGDGFSDGTGGSGGAIFHQTGDLTVINSTITGNRAGDGDSSGGGTGAFGGGIISSGTAQMASPPDTVTIISSTIIGNEAGVGSTEDGRGGGLFVSSISDTVDLENTIIAENTIGPAPAVATATSDIDIHLSLTVTTSGVNFIGIRDGASNFFPAPPVPGDPNTNGDFVGDSSSPLDPGLGTLADNGGPTLTILPDEDSLVIDPLGGDTVLSIPTDQRGLPRRANGIVDVGAAEFGAEDQLALDLAAAAAAAAAQQAAAAEAALRASILKKIKKFKKKFKAAKRKGQIAKAKKLKKKFKKFKKKLKSL